MSLKGIKKKREREGSSSHGRSICVSMCEIYIVRLSKDKISQTVAKKKKDWWEKQVFFFSSCLTKTKTFLPRRDEKKNPKKQKSNGTPVFYSLI